MVLAQNILSDSASEYKNHQIFLAGLVDSGQKELSDALASSALVLPEDLTYADMKTKYKNTCKLVDVCADSDDIDYVVKFDMEGYDPSTKRLIIFCFDSQKNIEDQLILLETLIILNKSRHFSGQYLIVTDIKHSTIKANQSENLIHSIKEDISQLKHANYLLKNKLPIFSRLDLYGKVFNGLKDYVFDFIASILKPKDPIKKVASLQVLDEIKFENFLADYKYEYDNAGIFKRSNFLKEYKAGAIKSMADVHDFVKYHPKSRTALLLKRQIEQPHQVKFARFLNKHEHCYYTAGLFKRSKFRDQVLTGEIHSMQQVNEFANANRRSRTATLLKTFR